MVKYRMVCSNCGHTSETDAGRCAICGGVVECRFDLSDREFLRKTILTASSFWDYLPLFPVESDSPITVGEGFTPLIPLRRLAKKLDQVNVFVKNEAQNPTGTFKDRCLSIALTKAREKKAEAVVIGSAGNAGASAAAYAARLGIPCYIFVPGNTPLERLAQSIAYGARILMVDGAGVTECINLIEQIIEEYNWFNVTTAYSCNPYQAEAEKAIAYEMAQCMSYEVPDWIIVPVGGGGCLTGIYKGYKDMFELGLVNKMPRMVAVQEEGCSPLIHAFNEKAKPDEIKKATTVSGIALPILDAYPLDGLFALQAIYLTEGHAEAVSSHEIVEAYQDLSQMEGIFPEIASASTLAALKKMRKKCLVGKSDSVICVITGSGLKDSSFVLKHAPTPLRVSMSATSVHQSILGKYGVNGSFEQGE